MSQKQFNYQKICRHILKELPLRQKTVLERRFGLAGFAPETLQAIGNDLQITRERVRQIGNEALLKLTKADCPVELKDVFTYFANVLEKSGGVKREDLFLAQLAQSKQENIVRFLLSLGPNFYHFSENDDLFSCWAGEKRIQDKIGKILNKLIAKLASQQKALGEGGILSVSKKDSPQLLLSVVELSKKIEQGPLGQFGLVSWPEIKPKGVRDAAFIVLKNEKKPLHFRAIAQFATELVSSCLGNREVLPQTVHNELIRDERFVLVGRGVYGLKDWGFTEGTVKQVIASVLRGAKKPLTREKILELVQKQRLVKPNTILLNLADKSCFQRSEQGRYILSEA